MSATTTTIETFEDLFGDDFVIGDGEKPPVSSDNELSSDDDLFGDSASSDGSAPAPSPSTSSSSTKLRVSKTVRKEPETKTAKLLKERQRRNAERAEKRLREAKLKASPFGQAMERLEFRRAHGSVRKYNKVKSLADLGGQVVCLVDTMRTAYNEDEKALAAGGVATHKLRALPKVLRLIRVGGPRLWRFLADKSAFFTCVHDWLKPSRGMLPPQEVRDSLIAMLADNFPRLGHDVLKDSRIGGLIEFLSTVKAETLTNTQRCRAIVANWARKDETVADVVQARLVHKPITKKELEVYNRKAARSVGIGLTHVVAPSPTGLPRTSPEDRLKPVPRAQWPKPVELGKFKVAPVSDLAIDMVSPKRKPRAVPKGQMTRWQRIEKKLKERKPTGRVRRR